MRRNFIIIVVWLCEVGIFISPYFLGKIANEIFLHSNPISWPEIWGIGLFVYLFLIAGSLFILAFWFIATGIADWAEEKFK